MVGPVESCVGYPLTLFSDTLTTMIMRIYYSSSEARLEDTVQTIVSRHTGAKRGYEGIRLTHRVRLSDNIVESTILILLNNSI